MIVVQNLTKYYGEYPAVRNVTFEVPRGRVVGFLGPNGAGKSTTMRILAGYLTATGGKASIDGKDVFWNPIESVDIKSDRIDQKTISGYSTQLAVCAGLAARVRKW